jgi:hypothetical protein
MDIGLDVLGCVLFEYENCVKFSFWDEVSMVFSAKMFEVTALLVTLMC